MMGQGYRSHGTGGKRGSGTGEQKNGAPGRSETATPLCPVGQAFFSILIALTPWCSPLSSSWQVTVTWSPAFKVLRVGTAFSRTGAVLVSPFSSLIVRLLDSRSMETTSALTW